MSTTSDAAPPPDLRVGDHRLLAKIGEGGMGVVHLAQAPDGRRVALKVLRPHVVGDAEARERLAREVASLRRVRSPHVAEVIDADPWGPTPYVTTRYVPGLPLHEHVRQEGTLTGDDLRHVAAVLAEAVLSVHSVGVLHRDIKPSNVLLEGRSPVLIDFGLARLAEDPRLTVTGWLLGTPGYLAPEILYGDAATPASDVHSWAATVVFAATGRPPYGRGPAVAIMDRVRRGEHDMEGVPQELEPLLRAALSPEPSARPALPALLADLRSRGGRRAASGVGPADQLTVPFALASSGATADDTATDAFPSDGEQPTDRFADAATIAQTRVEPPAPAPAPPTTPLTRVQEPVLAPEVRPEPPSQPSRPPAEPVAPAETAPRRPPPEGVLRLQRRLLVGGLFALVAVGFALAPYLGTALVAVTALALRTWSWTVEASQDRAWRRGRRRWYDGPLAAMTAPWYLLVATGGTLVLVLWAATLTLLVGLALLLFRLPLEGGLMVMGGALAFASWWGPGSRRLRRPTRALVLRTTRSVAVGWAGVAVVGVATALLAYLLLGSGTVWDPAGGPPWRDGTVLGDLIGLL